VTCDTCYLAHTAGTSISYSSTQQQMMLASSANQSFAAAVWQLLKPWLLSSTQSPVRATMQYHIWPQGVYVTPQMSTMHGRLQGLYVTVSDSSSSELM
jgi:hypothetical protein